MKLRTPISLLTLWAALVCSGCVAYHFTMRPGASGTVLDARTGLPVAGASVSLAPERGDDPAGTATTAADGSFTLPPRRQWGVYIVPGDVFPSPFTLSVQHDGYQPATVRFFHRAMGDDTVMNFGVLRLAR